MSPIVEWLNHIAWIAYHDGRSADETDILLARYRALLAWWLRQHNVDWSD